MDISVPIAAEVKQIAFSFATGEEIKKLSVKAINNPQTFDPVTQYPNVGGLYDPALGPFDKSQMCQTCRMNYFQCPGHFGHVELAVPVYHPLLFGTLFNILRAKCFFCHHFKLGGNKLYRYEARLKLLYAGLLKESMELENFDVTSLSVPQEEAVEVDGKNKVMDSKDFAMKIDHYVKNALKSAEAGKFEAELVSATNDYLKTLTKDLLKELIAAKKCNHCDAKSPTLRKESHSKIFENAMSATDLAQLQSKGFKREGLLAGSATPASRLSPNASVETRAEDEVKQSKSVYLTSSQIKEHMKRLWENEGPLLDLIFGSVSYTNSKGAARKSSYEQFFINTVAVPPTRFRPVSVMGDKQFDNVQNTFLADIIKFNNSIIDLSNSKKLSEKQEDLDEQTKFKRLITAWVSLQESVNNLHDATKNPKRGSPTNGIKQIMEKKEGLFRKHMMGKRVNYAARSVISPDPMIETSEIGVPMVFAKKLTYPEPVTQYNVTEMREAVINGPDVYPGATAVQLEDGTLTMLPSVKEQRIAIANQLLKPAPHLRPGEDIQYVNKKVYRHVKNGDMLLMNRQPTLHKPSIMAHTARILPGEKTIRMHYANCNTYNADFDGDEMNMHFPQNAIAQAEARLIMNNNNQYLVPTNGEPLRGLIQDHVVTGVMMSSRDTFLTREEYVNVIYASLVDHVPGRLRTIPPAMVKPQQLWTGKQVISTLLLNLTLGKQQLNLDSKSQVPSKSWSVLQKVDTEEGHVIIRDGNLLTGVLDKKQFGAKPNGLVHAVYEVYGADVAGKLLTCLGRLFTKYVQMIGFSCRMEDLVLDPEADKYRQEKIKRALAQGKQILKDFASESGELALIAESPLENTLKKKLYNSKMSADERDRTEKMLSALEDKRLYQAMENTIRSDAKLAQLDGKMKGNTGSVTTEIVKQLLPNGLRIPFPENGMQLMTVSGAKGSNVNVTQISCMLGQQELEGRRVPVMVSGKTLPSFRAYDLGPRAGGYITGRFLTGIKPQEYYFHCMAGREGLVDTAVKTARSGYLQRCLIKHLEGMKVNYDATVRDSADGSVYQFHYGEDSLDVTKASYLKDFKFNSQNYRALLQRYNAEEAAKALDTKKAEKYNKKAFKKPEKYQPALSKYNPHRYLGSVSESFYQDVKKYVEKNPDKILGNEALDFPSKEAFEVFMFLKYHRCLVDPGEAVGLLAAQSIGEPSTQMTLNTFHFAGHGAKNVTLGIPRLREIIMTASTQLKTPQMTAPFTKDVTKAQAELIARKMSRLTLDMLMVSASVTETMLPLGSGGRERSYRVRLHFCKEEDYNREYDLSFEELRDNVEKVFIKKLVMAIKKADKKRQNSEEAVDEIGKGTDTSRFNESSSAVVKPDEETSSSSKKKKIKSVVSDDENDDALDEDAHAASRAKKKKQHASYDEPDEEEKIKYSSDSDSEAEDENNADEKSYAQGMDLDEEQSLVRDDVIKSNSFVCDYKFDVVSKEWCEVELRFPAKNKKLLMVDIVESVAPSCIISEIPGISKCFVTKDEKDHLVMITEGVNIPGLFPYEKYIDVTGIQSNDIASIIKTYGVEAGRKTIMKEISSVFGVYGIDVDLRHLSLIADYMTFAGGYRAFNRGGIESNASPFSKMSFETAFHFLITSTLRGDVDNLRSPSARLVLGKVVEGGTGAFEVLHQMK